MKRPENAPSLSDIITGMEGDEYSKEFLLSLTTIFPTVNGKYLHWSELQHRNPPQGLDHRLWWGAIKLARSQTRKKIPLKNVKGINFNFGMPDLVLEMLLKIDGQATGRLATSDQINDSMLI